MLRLISTSHPDIHPATGESEVLSRCPCITGTMTAPEMRFWPRIGMRVTRETATQFIERMSLTGGGSRLDEDLEEFTTITPITAVELIAEIEHLFSAPDNPETPEEMDDLNLAILNLMAYEGRRKEIIMAHKEDGLSLEEAKDAYEEGKRELVRQHLDIPEDSDSEEE